MLLSAGGFFAQTRQVRARARARRRRRRRRKTVCVDVDRRHALITAAPRCRPLVIKPNGTPVCCRVHTGQGKGPQQPRSLHGDNAAFFAFGVERQTHSLLLRTLSDRACSPPALVWISPRALHCVNDVVWAWGRRGEAEGKRRGEHAACLCCTQHQHQHSKSVVLLPARLTCACCRPRRRPQAPS